MSRVWQNLIAWTCHGLDLDSKPPQYLFCLNWVYKYWDGCHDPLCVDAEKVEAKLSHFLVTKLGGNDCSALPRTWRLVCSIWFSLYFVTKCLKTHWKLESASSWQSNLGKSWTGFVLTAFHISFQWDFQFLIQRLIQSSLGKQLYLFRPSLHISSAARWPWCR